MKQAKLTRSLLAACSIVALSAAMYGCGGGGGQATTPPVPDPIQVERDNAGNAVGAAEMAVSALTEMSDAAAVTAAQMKISDAKTTVAGLELLPASEVLALQGRITAAEMSLGTKQGEIANYGDRTAASTAIGTAETAVNGLDKMSDDAAITAAESAIATAKQAVMDGSALTEAQRTDLNDRIDTAETNLGTKKAEITAYRTPVNAVAAAEMAVADLTVMSTQAEVDAAQGLIDTASTAVMAASGTALTASEAAALEGKIAIAQLALNDKEELARNYRTEDGQRTAANRLVGEAETAVNALNVNSSDADVDAAQDKIDAAQMAVDEGDMLTADEVADLNDRIDAAETSLSGVKTLIANQRRGNLYQEVLSRRAAAETAAMSAVNAVKGSTKYTAMFTPTAELDLTAGADAIQTARTTRNNEVRATLTAGVKGESMMATMNAQAVLDAEETVDDAVMEAKAAKTGLETAKMNAMEQLPDDAQRTALLTAIDEAITAVDMQIESAEEQADNVAFNTLLNLVKFGEHPAPTGATAREASYYGNQVARVIEAAIDPGSTFATTFIADATNRDGFPATPTDSQVVLKMSDRVGMTFADIVGEDNLVAKRIDRTAAGAAPGTDDVMAISFAGMALTDINPAGSTGNLQDNPTGTNPPPTVGTVANGAQWWGLYKGIQGTVFCAGSDCAVAPATVADDVGTTDVDEADASSLLIGSWYFTPAQQDETWTMAPGATTYTVEMDVVTYGIWFQMAAGGIFSDAGANTAGMNLLAGIGQYPVGVNATAGSRASGGTPANSISESETSSNNLETTASYTGRALGISAYEPDLDDDGRPDSISSGMFTADVNLNARFGSSGRSLSGSMSNFEGSAVNDAWTVTLGATVEGDGTATPAVPGIAAAGTINTGTITNAADPGDDAGATAGRWTAIPFGFVDAAARTTRPAGFFGTFNANFTDGDIAGAYSTRKD